MSKWFIAPPPRPDARLRVFAVPFAGRGASLFFPWRSLLPAWIELMAVQFPGREGRLNEPALRRIDTIVEALLAELRPMLNRPYALFGHSMGALVCFELARALRRVGAPMPLALAVSGRRAPTRPALDAPMHVMTDEDFIEAMRVRFGGIPQVVLDEPELLRLLLPTLRSDIEAIETSVHRPEPPLTLPFLIYGGREDRQATPADLSAWQDLTVGASSVRLFPGGHFYLRDNPRTLVDALTADLSRCCDDHGVGVGGADAAGAAGASL